MGKFEGKCQKISNGDQKIAENLRTNWKVLKKKTGKLEEKLEYFEKHWKI